MRPRCPHRRREKAARAHSCTVPVVVYALRTGEDVEYSPRGCSSGRAYHAWGCNGRLRPCRGR
eukprot:3818390-Alexandrium_andersonii.AAC.1